MEIIKVDAMGDACPVPVIKTLKVMNSLTLATLIETHVDNEIAVQNLTKMANQKGYGVKSEKLGDDQYKVTITVGDAACTEDTEETIVCEVPAKGKNVVVVISSAQMGSGSDELGCALMKGFLYALGQQEVLPKTILFYNGGASIPCEGSVSLEDLKSMEAQGVEILTCGTCLNFYGLSEKLAVGSVTNMYVIAEKMTQADLIVKP